MNDIHEIMYRLRKGQSVEAIHRDTGHAKKTIRKYRKLAEEHAFLEKGRALPAMSELAAILGPVKHVKQCVSTVEHSIHLPRRRFAFAPSHPAYCQPFQMCNVTNDNGQGQFFVLL